MAKGNCSVDGCTREIHCKGLCRPHYIRQWKYGDPRRGGPIRPRLIAAKADFWSLVDKDGPSILGRPDLGLCWVWLGRLDIGGYGVFGTRNRSSVRAHHVSMELVGRNLGEGEESDHLCHTYDLACPGGRCRHRACVNPDHLEPVSHRENALRSVRARTGRCRQGHTLSVVGYRNGNPKRGCLTCRAERRKAVRDELVPDSLVDRHPGVRVTGDLLSEVARVYLEAEQAGQAPRLAVARHFQRSPATTSDWVRRAREERLIPAYRSAG